MHIFGIPVLEQLSMPPSYLFRCLQYRESLRHFKVGFIFGNSPEVIRSQIRGMGVGVIFH
jgi:hypothetical protein